MVALNLSVEQVNFRFIGEGYQGNSAVFNEMPAIMGDSPCFSLQALGYRVWEGV